MRYAEIVEPAAARYGVPPSWVYAFIGTESGDVRTFQFNPVTAPTWEEKAAQFSWGPLQILESTARGVGYTGQAIDLEKPEISIPLAIKYMRQLIDRGYTDFRDLYSAYNSGNPQAWTSPGAVQRNVDRALVWLNHFRPKGLGAAAAVVVMALGFLLYQQRGKFYVDR